MSIYETRIAPHLKMISLHFKSGGTLAELARKLSVSPSTLRRCAAKHQELSELVNGTAACRREQRDDEVEDALFKRAVGFEQPDGKFSAPDVRAAIFWLRNRRPQEWSDKPAVSGAGGELDLSEIEQEL